MRLDFFCKYRQAPVIIALFLLISCSRSSDEIPVIPPPTNPMAREYIGYGVVNVSFIHVLSEPLAENTSLGFLRKKSIVKIIERRSLSDRGNAESWVKIDAPYSGTYDNNIQGWLRESSINVYNNEVQALTAAEVMNP